MTAPARGRAALAGDRRARAGAHRPGPPVLRALRGAGDGARRGQPDLRRGRQRVHRLHRRHRGRQRRPLSPALREGAEGQAARLTFGSFTTEIRAKFLELLARVTPAGLTRIQLFSGGAEAVEAALRLAKSATGKHEFVGFWGGFHGKTGGVLGLLGRDFKHGLGPFVPGMYLSPVRGLLPLSAEADVSRVRHRVRRVHARRDPAPDAGEIAAIIVEPMQGTAGNIDSAARVPARGPGDRQGARRALHRRRDDHGLRPHRQDVGRRPRRRRARHHDVGKGIGGGFPLSGVVSTDALTARHSPGRIPRQLVELRRQSAGRRGRARRPRDHRGREPGRERRAGRRGDAGAPRDAAGEAPIVGDVRGKGLLLGIELVTDRAHQGAARQGCHQSPLPGVPPPGTRRHDLRAGHPHEPAADHRRGPALDGLDILDEALDAVVRAHGLE